MSDDPTPSTPLAAAPEVTVLLEPGKVLKAAADDARRRILAVFSDGQPHSIIELAARIGRSPDLTSKHLRVLRDARLILPVESPDSDGRKQFHILPAPFITQDTAGRRALDFGTVVLRL